MEVPFSKKLSAELAGELAGELAAVQPGNGNSKPHCAVHRRKVC